MRAFSTVLFRISKFKGRSVLARDGEIGSIEDFYFDDEKWTIRYLVADTARWLFGRKVLIPRVVLGPVHADDDDIQVRITKQEIEHSPSIDSDKPVSRRSAANIEDHYEYPYYWPGPNFAGPITFPIGTLDRKPLAPEAEAREIVAAQEKEKSKQAHLRSTGEIINYSIRALDGDLGHVADFLAQDEDWTIRYVIVDTKNWLSGKKVLISPQWIRDVRWSDSLVTVDMSRHSIKDSPEYDPAIPPDRSYEERLYRHHGRRKYWA